MESIDQSRPLLRRFCERCPTRHLRGARRALAPDGADAAQDRAIHAVPRLGALVGGLAWSLTLEPAGLALCAPQLTDPAASPRAILGPVKPRRRPEQGLFVAPRPWHDATDHDVRREACAMMALRRLLPLVAAVLVAAVLVAAVLVAAVLVAAVLVAAVLAPACGGEDPSPPGMTPPITGAAFGRLAAARAVVELRGWGLRIEPIVHLTADTVALDGRRSAERAPDDPDWPDDPSAFGALTEALDATGDGEAPLPVGLVVDPDTPYRRVWRVLAALARAGRFEVVLAMVDAAGALHAAPHRAPCFCPPPRVTPGPIAVEGPCDVAALDRVAGFRRHRLARCHTRVGDPFPPVRLRLGWQIDAAGAATAVTVTADGPVPPALLECWREEVERWRFPRPAGEACRVAQTVDVRPPARGLLPPLDRPLFGPE